MQKSDIAYLMNPGVGVNWNFYKGLSVFLKVGYTYNANPCDDWIKPNEMGWVSEHGVSVSIGFGF